jgi:transcriptional regulator with XRE-family HTH domain
MASLVSHSGSQIMVLARQKLGLMQHEMASAIGTSLRTLSRYEGGASAPADFHLHKVAALVYPLDPELAREAAAAGGRTLEQLRIVKPAPSPPPAPPPVPAVQPTAVPARLLVDAVVCAVAAALEAEGGAPVPLARARTAVAAAFLRARDLRLGIDEAAAAVAPAPRPPESMPDGRQAKPKKRRPR